MLASFSPSPHSPTYRMANNIARRDFVPGEMYKSELNELLARGVPRRDTGLKVPVGRRPCETRAGRPRPRWGSPRRVSISSGEQVRASLGELHVDSGFVPP